MQHYYNLDTLLIPSSWATIGSFDGVHIGHQAIVRRLVAGARAAGLPSVVVTFHPHPAVVLGKINHASYLTTPEERADLLGDLGVDIVLTLPFTRQLAELGAADFMEMLNAHLGIRHLCVGYDFALGRGREGNVDRLQELGQAMGYDLVVLDPVENGNGAPVSSSLIRRLISEGQMPQAARLLGRYYRTAGIVVHGDGRGKRLGFPTANLDVWDERLMPPTGIYATWTWIDNKRCASVANLGVRPTFENQPSSPLLEVYIMDWDRDLYGQEIQVEFVERLRSEERFPSIEALTAQMSKDVEAAKEVLRNVP
jgi:riboflavin kinase/FMN adenylyltransferase